jgi:hypothetical protein
VDPEALMALARHGQDVATARELARAADATRVVLLIDRGEHEPALMIEVEDDTRITDGDSVASIPHNALVPAQPHPLPEIRAIPATAIAIDTITGELSAPIGAIEHLADVVKAVAQALGGRSVASAEFATSDPELPITIAARPGEPVLLSVADEQFELPEG